LTNGPLLDSLIIIPHSFQKCNTFLKKSLKILESFWKS